MKLYRLSLRDDDGHRGYSWHSSYREAKRFAVRFLHDRRGRSPEYEIIDLACTSTRKGLLALLNRYADHPDNG